MKRCDWCGRESIDDAVHCAGCGTALPDGTGRNRTPKGGISEPASDAEARKNVLHGALWCVGGLALTFITYVNAANSESGGSYLIAWGPVIFGALQFCKGVRQMQRQPLEKSGDVLSPPQTIRETAASSANDPQKPLTAQDYATLEAQLQNRINPLDLSADAPWEALSRATKLEMQGRAQEALGVYARIMETHPGTEVGQDARKSLESLRAKLEGDAN